MKHEYRYPKVGEEVSIYTDYGYGYPRWEDHKVTEIEENPHNNVVPYSFTTCCGKYTPTSAADGHWHSDSFRTGGWKITHTLTSNKE